MTPTVKKRIKAQWQDEDGYWIALKSGWQDNSNPQCHTIVEDTRADALSKVADAVPCDCRECQADKGCV